MKKLLFTCMAASGLLMAACNGANNRASQSGDTTTTNSGQISTAKSDTAGSDSAMQNLDKSGTGIKADGTPKGLDKNGKKP